MIRSVNFSYIAGSYSKLNETANGLHFNITASADNRDIREIRGVFRCPEFSLETKLNSQIDVGVIPFMANQSKVETDADLLTVLENYIKGLTIEDRGNLSSIYPFSNGESHEQRIIDLFLLRIGTYLAGLAFLAEPDVMNSLPFQFGTPYDRIDGNVLTRGIFDYLMIPFHAITLSGEEGEAIHLVDLMSEFINEWEGLFERGRRYDVSKVTIEVLNGYISYTTQFISRVQEVAQKVLAMPLPSKVDTGKLEARIEQLEKKVQSIIETLERKSDPFDLASLSARIRKLEGEIGKMKENGLD